MKCHVCGSRMQSIITDLPFKVNNTTIVIMKELPVIQCDSCSEYLLDDHVANQQIEMLDKQATLDLARSVGVPVPQHWNIGKQIRVDGPSTHQVKMGTPTMGGWRGSLAADRRLLRHAEE